jgi:hypothetical protein
LAFEGESKNCLVGTQLRFFNVEEMIPDESGAPQRRLHAVRAASVFVHNGGREVADEIEIVFNWKPQHLNVWPQRQYSQTTNPESRFIMKLESLGPKEFLGIDLLSVDAELPELIQVRSRYGVGRRINMVPQELQPKWKIITALFLFFAGLAATLYVLIAFLQFVLLPH